MEVQGLEIVVVALPIVIWWVREEECVFAIVSGDEVPEVFTLNNSLDQPLPGPLRRLFHGEQVESRLADCVGSEGLVGDMATEGTCTVFLCTLFDFF